MSRGLASSTEEKNEYQQGLFSLLVSHSHQGYPSSGLTVRPGEMLIALVGKRKNFYFSSTTAWKFSHRVKCRQEQCLPPARSAALGLACSLVTHSWSAHLAGSTNVGSFPCTRPSPGSHGWEQGKLLPNLKGCH